MEDYSWPYLAWDSKAKLLKRNEQKKPITMVKLMEHVGELIEMARNPSLIMKFSGSGLRLGATSGAMEITDQHASRCSLGPADAADAQQHVGTTENIAETSFPDEVEPGSLLAEHADPLQPQGQGAGQRQEGQQTASELIFSLEMVQTLMMHLVLANSTNWCFANCTFLCAVWALVCIDALDPGIRGDKFGLIQTFLKSYSRQKAALESENWFQALVQQWGQPLGQHDCSEFTNAFVSWLRAPAIDLRWESRVENAGQICVLDKGSFFMPITLQFPANHDGQGTKYLTTLFSDWRQVQGMTTALTQVPPLICVHLDRMYHDESGTLCKSACAIDLNSAVQVPHFCNSGVKHEMSTYILVAAAAHLGADGAGHYRALMKVRPSVDEALNPFQWILTQDNESPAPVWLPPEWMKKNLTTMWLVRDDCLLLPTHRDQSCVGFERHPGGHNGSHSDPLGKDSRDRDQPQYRLSWHTRMIFFIFQVPQNKA